MKETIMLAANYALCAEAVVQQAVLMQPRSSVSLLVMASMHELETLRKLRISARPGTAASRHTIHALTHGMCGDEEAN